MRRVQRLFPASGEVSCGMKPAWRQVVIQRDYGSKLDCYRNRMASKGVRACPLLRHLRTSSVYSKLHTTFTTLTTVVFRLLFHEEWCFTSPARAAQNGGA